MLVTILPRLNYSKWEVVKQGSSISLPHTSEKEGGGWVVTLSEGVRRSWRFHCESIALQGFI